MFGIRSGARQYVEPNLKDTLARFAKVGYPPETLLRISYEEISIRLRNAERDLFTAQERVNALKKYKEEYEQALGPRTDT